MGILFFWIWFEVSFTCAKRKFHGKVFDGNSCGWRLFENERFHFLLDFLRLERISHDIVYDNIFYLKSKRIYSVYFLRIS